MLLLLSGEGPSDMGLAQRVKPYCETEEFEHGPLCLMLDKLAEAFHGLQYSLLDSQQVFFTAKQQLADTAKVDPPRKVRLPGKKHGRETAYYYKNALALAHIAQDLSASLTQKVVAVLFRDADGEDHLGVRCGPNVALTAPEGWLLIPLSHPGLLCSWRIG